MPVSTSGTATRKKKNEEILATKRTGFFYTTIESLKTRNKLINTNITY